MFSNPNNIDDEFDIYVLNDITMPNQEQTGPDLDIMPVDEAAIKAVSLVGARVYELEGFEDNDLDFFVVGCQGSGYESQYEVARLMNEKVKKTGKKPAFILYLGDNIYDYGAESPTDPGFHSRFNKIYYDEKLSGINDVPSFVVLGNHDANQHKKAFMKYTRPQGKAAEVHQTAHHYVPDSVRRKPNNARQFQSVQEIKELFEQDKLPLKDLQAWNMPHYFYSIIAGGLQLFILDSNSLLKDFAEVIQADFNPEKIKNIDKEENQILWLLREYQKAQQNGKKIMFAMHNPLYTQTKRALPNGFDTKLYIPQKLINLINETMHTDSQSQSELIALMFNWLGTMPSTCFTAHDHNMNYFNSNKIIPTLFKTDNIYRGYHIKILHRGKPIPAEVEANKIYLYTVNGEVEFAAKIRGTTEYHKIGSDLAEDHERIKKFLEDPRKNPKLPRKLRKIIYGVTTQYGVTPPLRICQVGSGGGGGDLQKRKHFEGQPNTGCYLVNNGFVAVHCDLRHPQDVQFEYNTTASQVLQFIDRNHYPVRAESPDPQVEHLRNIVLSACDDYFRMLVRQENLNHPVDKHDTDATKPESKNLLNFFGGLKNQLYENLTSLRNAFNTSSQLDDVDYIHHLIAYFNQPELPSLTVVIQDMCQLMDKMTDKTSPLAFSNFFEKNYHEYPLFAGKKNILESIEKRLIRPESSQAHMR